MLKTTVNKSPFNILTSINALIGTLRLCFSQFLLVPCVFLLFSISSAYAQAPTGLAGDPGNSQVVLTWNSVAGASAYNVYRGTSSDQETTTAATGITSTTYTDTGLTNNTVYYYIVKAVVSGAESSASNEITVTPTASITVMADSGVDFSSTQGGKNWYYGYYNSSSDNTFNTSPVYFYTADYSWHYQNSSTYPYVSAHYEQPGNTLPAVRRWKSTITGTVTISGHVAKSDTRGGDGVVCKILCNGSVIQTYPLNYNDSTGIDFNFNLNVALNDNIDFAVYPNANNSYDGTRYTAQISASSRLNSPANLTATAGTTQIDLSWTGVTGAGSYNVKRSTDATAYTVIATGVSGTSYADTSVSANIPYSYYVAAVDNKGEGAASNIASAKIAQALTSIDVSPASVALNTNHSQQFAANGKDQFGASLVTQPSFTWSVDNGGVGSVDQNGLYNAGATAGTAVIRATSGSVSGAANVTVINSAPTISTHAVANPNPVTGTTTNLSVLGADDGGEANLTYTWSTSGTPPAPVTFSVNGSNSAKNAVATFTASGPYTLVVTVTDQQGLSVTDSVDVTVNPITTSTTVLSSLNPSTYGQSVTFTATITGNSPTGTVQFAIDGTPVGDPAMVMSDHMATYTTSGLSVGVHSITATYSGDANNNSSSTITPFTQNVNIAPTTVQLLSSANPLAYGQCVIITAIVNSNGSATGTIQFALDGVNTGSPVSLSSGAAAYSFADLAVGSHTITAVYSGDSNNYGSSALAFTQNVVSYTSVTTVTSSINPVVAGNTVTFTAHVSGTSPTGYVQFVIDGKNSGNPVVLSSGTASYSISTLTIGTHNITVIYLGDSNNGVSTSDALSETIFSAGTTVTSVSLSCSTPNPNYTGFPVKLAATVTPVVSDGAEIDFFCGSTYLGRAVTSGSTATFITPNIPEGANNITARYCGNATFAGSTSSAITQTINKPGKGSWSFTITGTSPIALGAMIPDESLVISPSGASTFSSTSGRINFETPPNSLQSINIDLTINGIWTPNPNNPNEIPSPLLEYASVSGSSYSVPAIPTAYISVDDGIGDSASSYGTVQSPNYAHASASGTHRYDATGSFTIPRILSTTRIGPGSDSYIYSITPMQVGIVLSGTTTDKDGSLNILNGQKCTASLALPDGWSIKPGTTCIWTVAGDTFQSWYADDNHSLYFPSPNPMNGNSVSWYWNDSLVSGGSNSRKVTCNAQIITSTGELYVGPPPSVSVNVWQPDWFAVAYPGHMVIQNEGSWWVPDYWMRATHSTSNPERGMVWYAYVQPPLNTKNLFGTGSLQLVQLVWFRYFTKSELDIYGQINHYKDTLNGYQGLDTTWPYNKDWFNSSKDHTSYYDASDSPGAAISDSTDSRDGTTVPITTRIEVKSSFLDYIMYQPPNSTMYVPVGSFWWGCDGDAAIPSTNYWADFINPAGVIWPGRNEIPFTQCNDFPKWSQNCGTGYGIWVKTK